MKRTVFVTLGLGLLLLPTAVLSVASAADCGTAIKVCECGDRVVNDYTLTAADPVVTAPCPGNGLILRSTVNLNMGGLTIAGTNRNATGLLLRGNNGSVVNGRVQNFDTGIKSDTSPNNVNWRIGENDPMIDTSLVVSLNRIGIDLTCADCTVVRTTIVQNTGDGVLVSGGGNGFTLNTCSRNGGDGLAVAGDSNTFDNNRCELNDGDGLTVKGSGNTLTRNLGGRNGGTGVLVDGTGNSLARNQGRTNTLDGVRGIGMNFTTDGRNYGSANGGVQCVISGHPTIQGKYC